ncbi:hypothetical protein LH384_33425, partial [Pseudomonas aeruginosa]|nr:hypothetical protein [Pseudomonas aeruginosa]
SKSSRSVASSLFHDDFRPFSLLICLRTAGNYRFSCCFAFPTMKNHRKLNPKRAQAMILLFILY